MFSILSNAYKVVDKNNAGTRIGYVLSSDYEPDIVIGNVILPTGINDITISYIEQSQPISIAPIGINAVYQTGIADKTVVITTVFPKEFVGAMPVYAKRLIDFDYNFLMDLNSLIALQKVFPIVPIYSKQVSNLLGLTNEQDRNTNLFENPNAFVFFQQIQSINVTINNQIPDTFKVTIQLLPTNISREDDANIVFQNNVNGTETVQYFYLSKYIKELILNHRASGASTSSNMSFSLDTDFIKKSLIRTLLYTLFPILPVTDVQKDTESISLEQITKQIENGNIGNASIRQFVNEIRHAIEDVEKISSTQVVFPQNIQKLELSATFSNSFAVHNVYENIFPFRQYLGTTNWQGQITLQFDGSSQTQLKAINDFALLQSNIQQLMRSISHMISTQPVNVDMKYMQMLNISKIYSGAIDIKSVDDTVKNFVVNIPFYQIDDISQLSLAKVLITKQSFVKNIVKQIMSGTAGKLNKIDVTGTDFNGFINLVKAKIDEANLFDVNQLQDVYINVTDNLKLAVAELVASQYIMQQSIVASQAISAQGIFQYADLYKFCSKNLTGIVSRTETIAGMTVIDIQNVSSDLGSLQTQLLNYITKAGQDNVTQLAAKIVDPNFFQKILQNEARIKDIATVFGQYRYLSTDKINSSVLNMKFNKQLFDFIYSLQQSGKSAPYEYQAQFIFDILSSTIVQKSINAQLVTKTENFQTVIDVVQQQQSVKNVNLYNWQLQNILNQKTLNEIDAYIKTFTNNDIQYLRRAIQFQLQYLLTIKNQAGIFANIANLVTSNTVFGFQKFTHTLETLIKPTVQFSKLLLNFIPTLEDSINMFNAQANLSDSNKSTWNVVCKNEGKIRGILEYFVPNSVAEALQHHIAILFTYSDTRLKDNLSKLKEAVTVNMQDTPVIYNDQLTLPTLEQFANYFEKTLNNIGTNNQALIEYLTLNVKQYFWYDFVAQIQALFTVMLSNIISSQLQTNFEQFKMHTLTGYPLIDFQTVYRIKDDADIKLAKEMLVRTAQQLHQNALGLVGTALNDTGTNSDNDVINKLNNIYGSKQFAQVYLDWYRNVNVSKLIELSLPYYLGRIKDKQEISKLAAVTQIGNIKDSVQPPTQTEVTNSIQPLVKFKGTIDSQAATTNIIDSDKDQYQKVIKTLDEALRQKVLEDNEQTEQTIHNAEVELLGLIQNNVSSDTVEKLSNAVAALDRFIENKTQFCTELGSQYLYQNMIAQLTEQTSVIKRLSARQAIVFTINVNNQTQDKQQYVYDQVLSFTVTREADNPVDVQVIQLPDSGLFTSNIQMPFISNSGAMWQPVSILLNPGQDIELYVGHTRQLSNMDKVFAGFIRDIQKDKGIITIIAEGYGQILTRPLFSKSKHFWSLFAEPRKFIVHQLNKVQSYQLGYRDLNDSVTRFVTAITVDNYQLQQEDKIFLQQLTTQPFTTNLYYPSSYWTGSRSNNSSLYWQNFEMHFNGYDIKPGYSAWDVIEDQVSLSPDFIAQVEPINELGQQRLFFGKPEWPFHYETSSEKRFNMSLSFISEQAKKAAEKIQKHTNSIKIIFDEITAHDYSDAAYFAFGEVNTFYFSVYKAVLSNIFFNNIQPKFDRLSSIVNFENNENTWLQVFSEDSYRQLNIISNTIQQVKDIIIYADNKLPAVVRNTFYIKNKAPGKDIKSTFANTKILNMNMLDTLSYFNQLISSTTQKDKVGQIINKAVQDMLQVVESSKQGAKSFLNSLFDADGQVKPGVLSNVQNELRNMYQYLFSVQNLLNQCFKANIPVSYDISTVIDLFCDIEDIRMEFVRTAKLAIVNYISQIIQTNYNVTTSSGVSTSNISQSIKNLYDIIAQYVANANIYNTTKLFDFGHRGILDELNIKIYPSGTKPFENYHLIDDSVIIKNKISLNTEVQNKVILYSPSFAEGCTLLFGLGRYIERLLPLISSGYEVINGMNMMVTEQIFDEDIPKDKIISKTVTTHFGTVPQARLIIQTHHLKKSLEDMYQGEIIIAGKANIKPYDIVYLSDYRTDMYGAQRVHTVSHIFSDQTGFVTSIRLMPIVEYKDLHHKVLSYQFLQQVNWSLGFIVGQRLIKSFSKFRLPKEDTLVDVIKNALKNFKSISKRQFIGTQLQNLFRLKGLAKAIPVMSFLGAAVETYTAVKQPDKNTPALLQHDKVVNPVNIQLLTLNGQPFQSCLDGTFIDKYVYLAETLESVKYNLQIFAETIGKVFQASTWQQLINDIVVGVGFTLGGK